MRTKRRAAAIALAALTSAAVALSACAGGGTPSPDADGRLPGIFSGGNFAFMMSYEASPDACRSVMSLIETPEGEKALYIDVSSGGTPYIAIDASSLLGVEVSRLRSMEAEIEVVNPGGEFYAVSGTIVAVSGEDGLHSNDPWSVYLPGKNPNTARAVLGGEKEFFVPGAYNMFILSKDVDNARAAGVPPSNLLIHDIRFYDGNGDNLAPDLSAGFDSPEGFGRPDRTNLMPVEGETALQGAAGESAGGWGQAVTIPASRNGGSFDAAVIAPGCVITVYYASDLPPELILQSWTEGAPESAGWAKVAPARVNGSGTAAQYTYEDMAAAFGGDFGLYLDQIFVGDTGAKLSVYSISTGTGMGGEAR
ncbi:MAG: hypothetical protein LBD49_04085 [Oscillospiraceae bacterium]|nr:hypothetical protein [Oscillospiraceae bacterium]